MQHLPKSYEMNCLKRNKTPRVQKNIFNKSTNLILLCDVIVCYFPSKTHSTTSSHAHHILWCSRPEAAKICQGIASAPGKVKLTRYQIHGWVPARNQRLPALRWRTKFDRFPFLKNDDKDDGTRTNRFTIVMFVYFSQQGSLTSLRCNLSNSKNFTIFVIFVVCICLLVVWWQFIFSFGTLQPAGNNYSLFYSLGVLLLWHTKISTSMSNDRFQVFYTYQGRIKAFDHRRSLMFANRKKPVIRKNQGECFAQ